MNYFAHGRRFVDQPYFLAGTALPDWLCVLDRRVRVRSRHARPLLEAGNERLAQLAAGIVQHHHDDRWFHQTRAFAELNLACTRQVRDVLPDDDSFRPSFVGHILVELLLDATLIAEAPELLDRYYATLDEVDPQWLATTVTEMTQGQANHLHLLIPRFQQERFLYDYLDDGKLLMRLNHVMHRVKLPPLPNPFVDVLPWARQEIARRKDELLDDPGDRPACVAADPLAQGDPR